MLSPEGKLLENAARLSLTRHFLVYADGQRHSDPSPRWATRTALARLKASRSSAHRGRGRSVRDDPKRVATSSFEPRSYVRLPRRVPSTVSLLPSRSALTFGFVASPSGAVPLSFPVPRPRLRDRLRLTRRERRVQTHGGWTPRHGPSDDTATTSSAGGPRRATPPPNHPFPPRRPPRRHRSRGWYVSPSILRRRRQPLRSAQRAGPSRPRSLGGGRRHGPRAVRGEPRDRSQDPSVIFQSHAAVGDVRTHAATVESRAAGWTKGPRWADVARRISKVGGPSPLATPRGRARARVVR